MSHQAAIYDVISDGTTILEIGGADLDEEFEIDLNPNANVGIKSVLSFVVDPVNSDSLKFELELINGSGVTTLLEKYTIRSDVNRVLQEVIGENKLTLTGNTLKVTVLSGTGKLQISDIVLNYQRDL